MRHNDYPATLLMEPAANDEPARYRMTPAASTMREWSAPLAPVMAYREACYEFERGDHAPSMKWVGVDVAGGPGRSATVTLPTAKTEPEAEVWHTEAPTVAGVYIASSYRGPDFRRHWDGLVWSYAWRESDPEEVIAISRSLRHQAKTHIQWLRLIEADTPTPAAQESAKRVIRMGPRCWRIASSEGPYGCAHDYTCDADGWISHTPTADAVCPVPGGVEFETKRRDGDIVDHRSTPAGAWELGYRHSRTMSPGDVVAWRPIQA